MIQTLKEVRRTLVRIPGVEWCETILLLLIAVPTAITVVGFDEMRRWALANLGDRR